MAIPPLPQLLEKALRTYPANTPERWDKVTAMVGSRSKAECVTRFKVRGERMHGASCVCVCIASYCVAVAYEQELVARVKAKRQQS